MNIDREYEKKMIEYVYKTKGIRQTQLDSFWKQFLFEFPELSFQIDESDLRFHFVLIDSSQNVWDLDEDTFAYLKLGAWAEELDIPFTEQDHFNLEKDDDLKNKILVTFQQRQNYRIGASNDTYELISTYFPNNELVDDDCSSVNSVKTI